ncbi:hypothetical protein AVEN_187267-1 [Araneus ventricosus]|uniref:Uncharacterized protein n=1 Tax=Araneus ventricosus TaxID=182803 RepID=A0A4Y2R1Q2_ARAVE|nr:hypothetical protein AVEN_187267-1 [Araneus ventricosus]
MRKRKGESRAPNESCKNRISSASKAGNSPVLHSIHLDQDWFFIPPIQVEKSGTSIHLKFQNALAVGKSDLLSPSTAALRYPYSFSHSADFRFATLLSI